jgi:cell division protein FtsB
MPSRIDRLPWMPTVLLMAALATLAACAQWPAHEAATPGPAAAAPPAVAASAPALAPVAPAAVAPASTGATEAATARLLAWQERLRDLPAVELAREIARRDPPADAAAAVELALALLQSRALAQATNQPPNGEVARALALLEPVARHASPWQATARVLAGRVAEQRRLEEQVALLQQQLRDQQRRNEQLAAQIEALRAIERSLGATRAPTAPGAPR